VFNLLSNALKFTEAGRITLSGASVETDTGRRMRIAVADTGIGIAPDKLDEVFESFRQADASTTRRFGGTGLGLAICRNLARAMGGDVMVESAVGQGTTFTIDLPLIEAEAAPATQPDGVPTAALLIVDRNPITRAMLRALLEERAGGVEFANTLEEASARLAEGGVALALFDEATVRSAGDDWAVALAETVAGAGAAEVAVLWRAEDDGGTAALHAAAVGRVIGKPVAGPALRDILYPADAAKRDEGNDAVLVTHAA